MNPNLTFAVARNRRFLPDFTAHNLKKRRTFAPNGLALESTCAVIFEPQRVQKPSRANWQATKKPRLGLFSPGRAIILPRWRSGWERGASRPDARQDQSKNIHDCSGQ